MIGQIEKNKQRKRHGASQLTVIGESLLSDNNGSEIFLKIYESFIKNLTASQIHNTNESGLLNQILPTKTLVPKLEESAKKVIIRTWFVQHKYDFLKEYLILFRFSQYPLNLIPIDSTYLVLYHY